VGASGLRVIAVRAPTAIGAELDASLTVNRAARVALVIVLILGIALLAPRAARAFRRHESIDPGVR